MRLSLATFWHSYADGALRALAPAAAYRSAHRRAFFAGAHALFVRLATALKDEDLSEVAFEALLQDCRREIEAERTEKGDPA